MYFIFNNSTSRITPGAFICRTQHLTFFYLPSFYLFFSGSSSALGELAVVVHGCCSAPRGLAILPALGVQHPPRTLARPFVLHPDKAAVQRQVVPNGVLSGRKKQPMRKGWRGLDKQKMPVCPSLQGNHYRSALAWECKSKQTGGSLKNTGFDSRRKDERGGSLRSLINARIPFARHVVRAQA